MAGLALAGVNALVSPVHLSNTWPAGGGLAKMSTREPPGQVPPPLPPLTVMVTGAPLPVTKRRNQRVELASRHLGLAQLHLARLVHTVPGH